MATKFVPRYNGMYYTLKSPAGPVGRHLYKRALIIQAGARAQVGFKTGRLKSSIHIMQKATPTGQEVMIGSPVKEYALIHHNGSKPHVILPRRVGGKLVFMSTSGGRMRLVVTDRVNHPGTKPNPYLTDWLFVAVLP